MSAAPTSTLKLTSFSLPSLKEGASFRIQATQSILFQDNQNATQQPTIDVLSQAFVTEGSRFRFDASLVDSVFPPDGHADLWFTVPHIAFTNDQIPWTFPNTGLCNPSNDPKCPYIGLLVCRDDELDYADDATFLTQLSAHGISDADGGYSTSGTKAISTSLQKYQGWTSETIAYLPPDDVDVIYLKPELFNKFFSSDRDQTYLAHTRSSSSAPDKPAVSVVLSSRTGPPNVTAPVTVHAHLVVLPSGGRTDNVAGQATSMSRCALVSLYSWSYTCLPSDNFDLFDAFRNLGASCAPLRARKIPDTTGADILTTYVIERATAGFGFARYIPDSGESLVSIYRGLLSPLAGGMAPLPIGAVVPKQSDTGQDLAVLDARLSTLDLTYQLAWQLGRSLIVSNGKASVAVMKLRGVAHKHCLSTTKKQLDEQSQAPVSRSLRDVLIGMADGGMDGFKARAIATAGPRLGDRWETPALAAGARSRLSFVNPNVVNAYNYNLQKSMDLITRGTLPGQSAGARSMSGTNTTVLASTDFSIIMSWIQDRLLLNGIPWQNLITDPVAFLPAESIRTFYIDFAWMDAFLDGALSVGEHFTPDDSARHCMKHCIKQYLADSQTSLPRWGFFIRSQLVSKFPDLQIIAPWSDENAGLSTFVSRRNVDATTLLVLFDRAPNSGQFPHGITLAPPGHQLYFRLGGAASWNFKDAANPSLTLAWRQVDWNNPEATTSGQLPAGTLPEPQTVTTSSNLFDFKDGMYSTRLFSAEYTGPHSPPWFASQLLAGGPFLNIPDPTTSNPDTHSYELFADIQLSPATTSTAATVETRRSNNSIEPGVAAAAASISTQTGTFAPPALPPVPDFPLLSTPTSPVPNLPSAAFLREWANTDVRDTSVARKYLQLDNSSFSGSGTPRFKLKFYNAQCRSRRSDRPNPLPQLSNNPNRRHIYTTYDPSSPNTQIISHDIFVDISLNGPIQPSDDTTFRSIQLNVPIGGAGLLLLSGSSDSGSSTSSTQALLPTEDFPRQINPQQTSTPRVEIMGSASRLFTVEQILDDAIQQPTMRLTIWPSEDLKTSWPAFPPSITLRIQDQMVNYVSTSDAASGKGYKVRFSWVESVRGADGTQLPISTFSDDAYVWAVSLGHSCRILGVDDLGTADS